MPLLAVPVLLAGVACAVPAAAQNLSQNEERCWNEFEEYSRAQQIAACTALIQAGQAAAEDLGYIYGLRGWAHFELENYAQALADQTEAVRLLPQVGEAYSWRASTSYALGEYHRAAEDYSAAIRLDPESPSLSAWYHDLGLSHAALGEWERALADYSRAIEADPSNASAFGERADVHFERQQYDCAVEDYSSAIALLPDEPGYWNGRCWARAVWNEEIGDALADCDWALSLDPYHAAAFDSRGLVNLRLRQWEAAAADYDAALAIEPDFASAYFGRGIALVRSGRAREGEADLARAVRLDPEIAEVYASLGMTP